MKCGQYWPNETNSDEHFEEFIVYNNSIVEGKDLTESHLMLHNTYVSELEYSSFYCTRLSPRCYLFPFRPLLLL